jgi:hypothetical protein
MVLSTKERTDGELDGIRKSFSSLMVATEIRGRHATGAFVLNRNGACKYYKAPKSASTMMRDGQWWGLMDYITNDTVAVIGHVRYATHGSPDVNSNNHPIIQSDIVGVHNGVISNDCELCEQYPYDEDVDSAAIFSMLATKSAKKRLNTDMIGKALPELEGSFAIMVADGRRRDSIFVARDAINPLVYHKDLNAGIIWLSSTGEILRKGLRITDLAVMFPAYSVARISPAHAKNDKPLKVSIWHKPVRILSMDEDDDENIAWLEGELMATAKEWWEFEDVQQ